MDAIARADIAAVSVLSRLEDKMVALDCLWFANKSFSELEKSPSGPMNMASDDGGDFDS